MNKFVILSLGSSPPMFDCGYKVGIIGKMQIGKSTLALNIAQDLVEGRDILGYFPWDKKWRVLYINFELPEIELKARLALLGSSDNFRYKTLDHMSLARQKQRIIDLLEGNRLACERFDCLILDPKQYCFGSLDENQTNDNIEWCAVCDEIIKKYNICLIIVHHFGRNENASGGRGSTAFGAWLTKRLELKSDSKWQNKNRRILEIRGKVGESIDLELTYKYPFFRVDEQAIDKMKSKVQGAMDFIMSHIPIDRNKLVIKADEANISLYALHSAQNILKRDRKILLKKAEGSGNRKRIIPMTKDIK